MADGGWGVGGGGRGGGGGGGGDSGSDGGWRMADGGWRMADGGWRMADGGWQRRRSRRLPSAQPQTAKPPTGAALTRKTRTVQHGIQEHRQRSSPEQPVVRIVRERDDLSASERLAHYVHGFF